MPMSRGFASKKQNIINGLAVPDEEYTDASPKGSVDEHIRELVNEINSTDGLVTTSSCSGRIAVFLEGVPKPAKDQSSSALPGTVHSESSTTAAASAGGKGGGRWLYISHDSVELERHATYGAVLQLFGLPAQSQASFPNPDERPRYVHFKFEPMILHILTETPQKAQLALNAALSAGFRESGISSILDSKGRPGSPMVAVRSSGLAIDSVIGFSSSATGNEEVRPMVTESYLRTLLQVANERFEINTQRTERFRQAFLAQIEKHAVVADNPPDSRKGQHKQVSARPRSLREQDSPAEAKRSSDDGEEASYGFDVLLDGPD